MSEKIVDLSDYRSGLKLESNSTPVAYFEAVWGSNEYGWNALVVDIEALRRGAKDLTPRPPETSYEIELIVRHLRAVANDISRDHRMNHLIKPEDDL